MSERFPGIDDLDDDRLHAAIVAWREAMGLARGEYLPVRNNILVPFGATITGAVAAAIRAYEAAPPSPNPADRGTADARQEPSGSPLGDGS